MSRILLLSSKALDDFVARLVAGLGAWQRGSKEYQVQLRSEQSILGQMFENLNALQSRIPGVGIGP